MIIKGKKIIGTPMVSSEIAAHNEADVLEACVNSLLNQSYGNVEVLIVENGDSTDGTLEVARKLARENKNVRAFSIPGKQKGPGKAWNFAVSKARGKIIMQTGADMIYGKDYIKDGLKPILAGETIGVTHIRESCNNLKNLWGRAFFKTRTVIGFENGGKYSKVVTLIPKEYLEKYPYDSGLGYADDQTINRKTGIEFFGRDLEVYHTNPASFKETWEHDIWIGSSYGKPWIIIFGLPLSPLWAIYKTAEHLIRKDFYWKFIYFLPVFYFLRYIGYFVGAIKRLKR